MKKNRQKNFYLYAILNFSHQSATLLYGLLEMRSFHSTEQKYLHLWSP